MMVVLLNFDWSAEDGTTWGAVLAVSVFALGVLAASLIGRKQ